MARPTRSAPEGRTGSNKRGSPEAVEKRRLARKLNRLLTEGSDPSTMRDGRTERKRQRLLLELDEGTRTNPPSLKPIEILLRVSELLVLGETVAALRKVVKIHPRPAIDPEEARTLLAALQGAYDFRPESYEFLGLPPEVVTASGVSEAPKRGRPRTRTG